MDQAEDGFPEETIRRDIAEGVARVVAVDGRLAWLEPEQTTSCGGCMSASACGMGGNARRLAARRFSLVNEYDLRVGDRVVVGVTEGALVKAAGAAYGLPLLGLVAGLLLSRALDASDGAGALAALAGLVLGLLLSRLRAARLSARGELSPRFLRRVHGPGPGGTCELDHPAH